jgi:AcrR family transcriptional regulator
VPRTKQRTPELREKVLQAAIEMLTSDGLTGFTARRVAEEASTSTPAVYELFGDKAGLVREVVFEGFRMVHRHLEQLEPTDDPRSDLERVIRVLRRFAKENPTLAELMFSRPIADFDPRPADRTAGAAVREFIVAQVRRCIDARIISGNPKDISHVLVAVVQGLALQETAGWLGTSKASIDRRWSLAIAAVLHGLSPTGQSQAR